MALVVEKPVVMAALELTHPTGVYEIRVLNTNRHTVSGYYDDHQAAADKAVAWNSGGAQVYVTLNPVKPELKARAVNRTVDYARNLTTDGDIERRNWLFIDLDPVRASGISSTDEEHEAAIKRAKEAQDWLRQEQGWPEPILADSGNGAHLLYKIDLPNDDESRDMIKHILEALNLMFSDEIVEVDRMVYNAARIIKVYGTLACKGDNMPVRPHRLSKLLEVPEAIETVPMEQLKALADIAPQQPETTQDWAHQSLDVDQWLEKYGLEVAQKKPYSGGWMWVLAICPWDEEHKGTFFIIQFSNGAIMARCHHNSCQGKGWHELRDKYEPGWRETREATRKSKDKNVADKIVSLAKDVELFHDPMGIPWARYEVNGHYENRHCSSREFRRHLGYLFYQKYTSAPTSDAIKQALGVLEGKAVYEGSEYDLGLRVVNYDDGFGYDLADRDWRAVKVTPGSWEIISDPPILFRRYTNTAPQVEPVTSDNGLHRLLDFVNLTTEAYKRLFLVNVVTCLVPDIAHTAIIFHGEKGAAKSTAMRVLRKIIDPAQQELVSLPTIPKELALHLSHNYMPAYDNLDYLRPWQSDMMCCASTGGGISYRQLYTDDGEVILIFKRCTALNGINLVADRADLLDRALIFELERIQQKDRRAEEEFWAEFERVRPEIVGGIFSALAEAMKIYPTVKLKELPRMADFCRWGYAVAEALGFGGQIFLDDYKQNISTANEMAVSSSPLATAILSLMKDLPIWEGTASNLMEELERIAAVERINIRSRGWPKGPNAITGRLREIKSNLEDIGIKYTEFRSTSSATKGRKVFRFEKSVAENEAPAQITLTNDDFSELLKNYDAGEPAVQTDQLDGVTRLNRYYRNSPNLPAIVDGNSGPTLTFDDI